MMLNWHIISTFRHRLPMALFNKLHKFFSTKSPNKKTLYLHIGTGKTGSTSIQATLSNIEKRKFHFQYDMQGRQSVGKIDDFIKRLKNTEHDTIIYSNEWLFQAKEKFLEKFSAKLLRFFNVKIIIYIRRQDQFIVSAYQQVSKDGLSKHGPIALPLVDNIDVNYYELINKWANYFGKKNIIIRVFDRDLLLENDVVIDFCNVVNIEVSKEKIKIKNISNGFEKTKVAHLINMSNLRTNNNNLRKIILNNTDNNGKLKPSRADAIEVYNRYIESNTRLNNEYKISSIHEDIFGQDFSIYTEERQDIWDENSANQAILNIFNALANLQSLNLMKHADLLRDSAIALENENMELSYQLMSLAHIARPSAPLITSKLDEYKKIIDLNG